MCSSSRAALLQPVACRMLQGIMKQDHKLDAACSCLGCFPGPKDPAKVLMCLQDSILVAGYPLGSGSESLSITKGIVSRVVMARYSTAQTSNKLLGVQIDAAINFGNRCSRSLPEPFLAQAAAS